MAVKNNTFISQNNMYKFVVSLITLLIVAAVLAQEKYSSQFDSINFKDVIGNKRLLASYCTCLLDKGPCTDSAAYFKKILPEALATDCEKCTVKQRDSIPTLAKAIIGNDDEECFRDLTKKYDPTGEYRKKYEALLNK